MHTHKLLTCSGCTHAHSRLHPAQVAKDARLARLAKLAPGPASAADKRA
jgi:hypothetical protein